MTQGNRIEEIKKLIETAGKRCEMWKNSRGDHGACLASFNVYELRKELKQLESKEGES